MISKELFLGFADEALQAMATIVDELGDELANTAPALPGANTPYAILTHCLGVCGHWASTVNLGQVVPRDRDSEFTARGETAALLERTRQVRADLRRWVEQADPSAPPANPTGHGHDAFEGTQGGVLLHVYQELSQHLGQLELTRDILHAGRGAAPR